MASPNGSGAPDRLESILQTAHERSPLYDWMDMNYERIARLTRGRRIRWKDLIAYVAEEGIRDGEGKVPTADRMSSTWWKVRAARERAPVKPDRASADRGAPIQPVVAREVPEQEAEVQVIRAGDGEITPAGDRALVAKMVAAAPAPVVPSSPPAARSSGGTQVAGSGKPERPEPTDEQVDAMFANVDAQLDRDERGSWAAWNRKKRAEEDAAGVKRM